MNGSAHDYARLSSVEQEALEEMLSAFALGALLETEAEDVARHLSACPQCRVRAEELATTAGLLAVACDDVEPSPTLRTRLLTAVDAERRAGPAIDGQRAPAAWGAPSTRPGAEPPPPPLAWRDPGARREQAGTRWAWALPMAALLLVSIGLGVWGVQLQRELERQGEVLTLYQDARHTWRLAGSGPAAEATATLVEPTAGRPLLVTQGLPNLPASQAYQVWVIRNGQPASARVFPAGAGGQLVGELEQGLQDVSTVAVTVEPAGGSAVPTTPVVLAANL
jgi:hypothetical protein